MFFVSTSLLNYSFVGVYISRELISYKQSTSLEDYTYMYLYVTIIGGHYTQS